MKLLLYFIMLLYVSFEWQTAKAQTTNISGIINSYAAVTAISTNACKTIITVNTATGFSVGDSVMIIQMKGATIDSTAATSLFGNVLNMQSAGKYEIFSIAAITGNQITFTGSFVNTYSINGKVQLVRIPVYNNAIVTGLLTCLPWDGQTGGVLAFFANNTLTLNSDIDVTGKGFRGGDISNNPDGSCGGASSAFFYDLYQPGASWLQGGAMKGEGISELSSLRMAGKGHLANGGGGGNKHNTGGGGGSNYSNGGKGGNELGGCVNGNGGLGGEAISYASSGYSILVLGGGGGCGDYNNNVGSDGTNGGGIILIKANTIIGNNFDIRSDGSDNLILATGISDGAGGGGAGGAIYLHAQNYTSNLNIEANGGHGGDQGPGSFYGCAGPGGGGGTGIIMVNLPSLPANVNTTLLPGTSGIIQNPALTCYNTPWGATNGLAALSSYIPNVNLIYGIPSVPITPVNLGNDTILCPGQTLVLHAGIFASYSWQDFSTNSTYLVTAPGTYSVTVTDNSGCTSSDMILVNGVNNAVNLGNDTTLCAGEVITLSAPFVSGATYLWQDNSTNNSFTATAAGNYWVEVSISNCKSSDTIHINYSPLPSINLGNDTLICSEESFFLDASTPNATYMWQNNSTNATLLASATNMYWVDISVNNCHNRDTIFVGLKDSNCYCNLFIPNAFSPNNDLKNDELKIVNAVEIDLEYFAIYNRYGQIIFETNNVNEKWNGKFKNKDADVGTYFYQIKYTCKITGRENFLKGDITLIR